MSDHPRDEFFIGYSRTPTGLRRFLWRAGVVVLIVGVLVGVGLAALQRDPGSGVWDLNAATGLEGVIDVRPYPLIRVIERGRMISVLLVGEGKIGAAERVAGAVGKRVKVRGHTLARAAVRMFEIEDGAEGLREIAGSSGGAVAVAERGPVELRGEIVDPKCFAGAMKPGDGKTHKGCAVLCLRGGIPPVLVTPDGEYLLVDEAGDSLRDQALERIVPFVGEAVEVRGMIEVRGDLRTLRVSPGAVRRL
jgi:hypothetical protein